MTLAQEVCDIVGEAAGHQAFLDSTFEGLGIDSLDFVNMILEVENKFGIKIPEKERMGLLKTSDLIEAVASQRVCQ